MIIKYSAMSGIKLTLLLPLINQQIKHAIDQQMSSTGDDDLKTIYTMFICHSNARCEELAQFARDLTFFCTDIVDIVKFDQLDF